VVGQVGNGQDAITVAREVRVQVGEMGDAHRAGAGRSEGSLGEAGAPRPGLGGRYPLAPGCASIANDVAPTMSC
jgi:hypothetical protein